MCCKRKINCWAVMAILAALLAGYFFTGPEATGEARAAVENAKSSLSHVVLFYLKEDAPEGTADGVIKDAHAMLKGIPSVRHIWAGKPSKDSRSGPVATDYDAALNVIFDDADGLKEYIRHPDHVKYARKYVPLAEKVVVYDFE